MAVPRKKIHADDVGVSIEQSLRALDQGALELMRSLDVRRGRNWKYFIACAQRAGLTLRDIADALPCAVSTVSRWQAGKSVPPEFARVPMKDLLVDLVGERLKTR